MNTTSLNRALKNMEKFCTNWSKKHQYNCDGCPLLIVDGKYVFYQKPCFTHLFRDIIVDYENGKEVQDGK